MSAGLNALVDFRFYPVGKFSATSTCPGAGNDKGCEMDMLEACVVQHTCPYGSQTSIYFGVPAPDLEDYLENGF